MMNVPPYRVGCYGGGWITKSVTLKGGAGRMTHVPPYTVGCYGGGSITKFVTL